MQRVDDTWALVTDIHRCPVSKEERRNAQHYVEATAIKTEANLQMFEVSGYPRLRVAKARRVRGC